MTHTRTIALALACAPLIAGFEQPANKLAFSVSEGDQLDKVFSSQLVLELDEMRVLRDGQEPDGLPELEMKVTTDLEVLVKDRYLSMRDGAPAKLHRTFDGISADTKMSMEVNLQGQTRNQEAPINARSKLEGQTVQFLWDDESGEYKLSFVEEEGDEDLLDELFEDMDLRSLLPGREVEVGDEWEVEPHHFATVMAPGGDLKLVPEDSAFDMSGMSGQMGELSDWFDENLQGKIDCRLTEVRKDGEVSLAVVAISMRLENDVDLTQMAQEELDRVELPPGTGEVDVEHMQIELQIEGEGFLLWDLTNGHFHTLEIESDLEMKMDIGVNLELPGFGAVLYQQEFDMSGDLTFGAEIQ